MSSGYSLSESAFYYHDNTLGEVSVYSLRDSDEKRLTLDLIYQARSTGRGPCEYTNASGLYYSGDRLTVYDPSQYKIISYAVDLSPNKCESLSVPKEFPELIKLYDYSGKTAYLIHLSKSGMLYTSQFNENGWVHLDSTIAINTYDPLHPIPSRFLKSIDYNESIYVFTDLYSGSYYKVSKNDHSVEKITIHNQIIEPYFSTHEKIENFDLRLNSIVYGTVYYKEYSKGKGFVLHGDTLAFIYSLFGQPECNDHCLVYDLIDLNSDSYIGSGIMYDGTKSALPRISHYIPVNARGIFAYIERDDNSIRLLESRIR
jgi:hypothetical protein